ncbi:rod shape-determining protein MreC [Shumkonia mesophila]|uniref:rod shape-determining protein MreC n=1 Tax=Shumkonia mesophila TaxID=2838854 RepID=UPI002934A2FC|nr:rod shape-determining protein MreC [Shumkonia mesophila]
MNDKSRPVHRVAAPIRSLQRFAYLGLVVAAFGLMMLGKADVVVVERFRAQITDTVAPLLDAVSRPVATVNDVVAEAREMINLRAENTQLRKERDRLLQWEAAGRRLEAENVALQRLLNFIPHEARGFISARVIADTGGAFAHSLVLNAGADDEVRRGQAVVSGDGLVGRVVGVGARSSRILLLTDLNSRIPVVTEQSRVRAVLAGNNTSQPVLGHLPPNDTVTVGERVVTSGHGGVFPPGLPVGVIVSVGDSGAVVQPLVATDRLEYVRVIDYGLDQGVLQPQGTTAKD